jgi:hypothetical protein
MSAHMHQNAPIPSDAAFRAWRTSRPDEDHWELIAGIPVMKGDDDGRWSAGAGGARATWRMF